MKSSAVLVALLVVASVASATANVGSTVTQEEGTVVGRPNLELTAPENRFGAGQQATLEVFVSNNGDLDRGGPSAFEERVTTARNVRMEIDETKMSEDLSRAVDVNTGTVFAGTVPEGVSGPFAFNLEVSDSLAPGTYQIPVEVSYDYTNFVRYAPNTAPEYGDLSREQTAYVTVVVEDRPRFEIASQSLQRVTAGDTEAYRMNLTNTGTQPALASDVSLSAGNSSIFFGNASNPQESTSVFFERIDPGETKTFDVTVGATSDTAAGTYLAEAVVAYQQPNGVEAQSDRLRFGVAVGGDQTFAVRSVDSSLAVGDTGAVSGTVVNTGENDVSDAVVVLQSANPNLVPRETEYAVGDLASGERANFSFDVDSSNATDAGPRRVSFRVRYRNPDGDQRTSDPTDVRVAVAREQTFDVSAVGEGLRAGERGAISGTVRNDGNRSVSNAVVVVQTTGPALRPRETEYALGTLGTNESATFSFPVDVPNGTDPGPRQVSVRVRYRNAEDEVRYSDSYDAAVSVGGDPTFDLRNVSSDLRVGDSGTVSGTVVNTGDTTVSNAVVVMEAEGSAVEPRGVEYAVGDLEPGESVPFEFTLDVPNETDPGPRQLSLRVRYRSNEGELRASDQLDARVTVGTEMTFGVRRVNGTLRVGETGDVVGELVNTGEESVSNAVVVLRTDNPNVVARETEYAVGDLAPGESVPFEFTADVNSEAEAGPRQFTFRVRYRNRDGDLRTSDPVDARVMVGEERDEFAVEVVDATVPAGSSAVVEFRVTNAGDETLRTIDAKLFTGDPLSSDNDEAFVLQLAPNQSALLKFRVSAAGSAIPKTYPVSVDFSYENERGDDVLSDTYRLPVNVVERERGGFPFSVEGVSAPVVALGVGAVVALCLGWWKREALARLLSGLI